MVPWIGGAKKTVRMYLKVSQFLEFGLGWVGCGEGAGTER